MTPKRRLRVWLVLYISAIVLVEGAHQFADALNLSPYATEKLAQIVPLLLTTIIISAIFHFTHEQTESVLSFLSALGTSSRIKILSSAETYRSLRESALTVRSRLFTSYFGSRPPIGKPEEKGLYHRTISTIHKRRPNVQVHRIVLLTRENLPWIKELSQKMAGCENASLSAYCHKDGNGLPLSLQLVDQSLAILVNPTEKSAGALRDIVILDPQAVDLLDGYYKRIWNTSRPVVRNGIVRKDELERLEQLAASFTGHDDE